MDMKDLEKILYPLVGYMRGSRKGRGRTIREFSALSHDAMPFHDALSSEGFKAILLSAYHAYWASEERLEAVEYVEGDVYLVRFDDKEELDKDIEMTLKAL